MIQEHIRARGDLRLVLTDSNGRVKVDHDLRNLVVTTGREFIASRMVSGSAAVMSHMAIGANDTAPAVGNTTLGSEAARVALSSAAASGAVASYSATFPSGSGTGAITEAGIFNAGSGGTMLNRVTFPVVNKQAGDTLAIAWTVTIS